MHSLADLAALDDQGRLDTFPDPYEMLVDGAYRKQGRNDGMILIDAPVAQHYVVDTLVHGRLGLAAELVQGILQAGFSRVLVEQQRQDLRVEALVADVAQHVQFVIRKDWLGETDHLAMALIRSEYVHPDCSDILSKGHDQVLPDRVDRRVGDLRELLPEIIEQELRPLGKGGEPGIVSHGGNRLGPSLAHRDYYTVNVFLGVVESPQFPVHVIDGSLCLSAAAQLRELDTVGGQPSFIIMGVGEFLLDLLIAEDLSCTGIRH